MQLLVSILLSFLMAHITSNLVVNRFRRMQALSRAASPEPPHPKPSDKSDSRDGIYRPTPLDITVTRIMLTRSLRIPPDLVDSIFDYAEYWAHSINVIDYQAEHQDSLRIAGNSATENKFLLRSYPLGLTHIQEQDSLSKQLAYDTTEAKPLPRKSDRDAAYFAKLAKYPTPKLLSPARKVVFTIKSHDQGWSSQEGRGTYKSSWTWFEAGLERFDADQSCNSRCTSDARQESADSGEPSLSVCALRPLRPEIEKEQSAVGSVNVNGDDGQQSTGSNEEHGDEDRCRYIHPLHRDPDWEIQRNKAATMQWQEHVVTWSYLDDMQPDSDAGKALDDQGRGRGTGDGSFVRNLRLGDVVTVWGKARFTGWVNTVDHVKIEVYWAV
ncbi:uncharacterized protein UV8b_01818 [Ustilaginoidea virens]|uniref:Ankyrin repeat protein n=1 Tax=Ustilaginoidea virens TaxID=1159556 RepID=A0A8E5HLN2_USTVR|nr:uncharacterized protein UV8b_01818 [Ustilaginoidea virens]QUC17577.1 hypothetical protein UV8b_01818 [Ustilaginoidea virens]